MPPTVAVEEDEDEEAPRRWPLASSSSEASLAPHPTVRTGEEDEEATSQTPEVSYYVAGSLAFFSPFPWHPLSDGLSVAGCRIGVVLRGGASAAI